MNPPLSASSVEGQPARPRYLDAKRRPYEPAIGPKMRVLLILIFVGVGILGASGVYLLSIRIMEWQRAQTFTNQFTLWMFLTHSGIGLALIAPFLFFGMSHYLSARNRKNQLAVRLGIGLFFTGLAVGVTGVALFQLEGLPQLPTGSVGRAAAYWLHILTPILAVALYVLHRRAGPDINWRLGAAYGASVALFVAVMGGMHSQDPRKWYAQGPKEGERYFEPSKARTADGNFIAANVLMMDDYCLRCHEDIYRGWFHSAHHFSSFNNPPYRFSVRETRQVSLARDGDTRPSRWCAGCHDPVPFFSGAFDDPKFDDVNHPTAQAGITCTVCHAITNINSTIGNADYTIEEPSHYPLAFSKEPALQWINNQIVKAKPDFHKKTFLKPFHRSAEFCSTCHKVGLPIELNHYKEFLRGQNHHDTYVLSGVSGHGVRSFYYPPVAKTRCTECHAPLKPSADFGSRDFDGSGLAKIHDHLFPAANTGLPSLLAAAQAGRGDAAGFQQAVEAHANFLRGVDPDGKDKKLRVDIFGIKEGGTIDGKLIAPLRPSLPALKPGSTYLVEVVLRTLGMGHPFPQGTADSNEIWVDFEAKSGQRVVARSGGMSDGEDAGSVDEWSHFVNVHMLDRNGNRINRRNPQDIFTPLYDHQIPPGAAQVVHYRLAVPEDIAGPIELKVRLRYRKFDHEYMLLVNAADQPLGLQLAATMATLHSPLGPIAASAWQRQFRPIHKLPIVDVCEDRLVLAVDGRGAQAPEQKSPIKTAWERWNDYGIGCFLEGGAGLKKGELRQAEEAFRQLIASPEKAAHAHGYTNLARVLFDQGRLPEAAEALNKAGSSDPPAPWWTLAWFTGLVNAQNGHLDEAIENFKQILDPKNQPRERKFDFTLDYVVWNELGSTYFRRSQQEDEPAERDRFLGLAVECYEKTLSMDREDVDAHYGLAQCYLRLGERVSAKTGKAVSANLAAGDLARHLALLVDRTRPDADRMEAARRLAEDIGRFGEQAVNVREPKLPVFLALRADLVSAFQRDEPTDAELRPAMAFALGRLHRQLHLIYKPDDNARDRTIRLYRQTHPAADHASQAIVLYDSQRPGAFGLVDQERAARPR